MKYCFLLIIGVFLLGYSGCSTEGKKGQSDIANGMELSVEPGEHWLEKMKVFIFSIKKAPQMAAWIENNQGQYVSTITVTNKSAVKKWRNGPKEGRPEALPVWNHKAMDSMAQVDSVSAATSKKGINLMADNTSLIKGSEYNVYLEVNHSFDYNETWPKKENDVNGQPSLVYHAKFTAGMSGRIELKPMGYGSADGSDGNIVNGLTGMTTALIIIDSAYLIVN